MYETLLFQMMRSICGFLQHVGGNKPTEEIITMFVMRVKDAKASCTRFSVLALRVWVLYLRAMLRLEMIYVKMITILKIRR